MQKVVSNSSPLIHLAKIDRLSLLPTFFREILVPEAVYQECVEVEGHPEGRKQIKQADWINVLNIENKSLKKALSRMLDVGEAEAIVLALEESADLILLDEYEARGVAREFDLHITGVIGILLRANAEGRIKRIGEEFQRLRETGFWISDELYKEILQERKNTTKE